MNLNIPFFKTMLFKKLKANKFANALSNAIEIEEREKKVMRLERMQSTSKDIKNATKDM